jgi:hypothetical protein
MGQYIKEKRKDSYLTEFTEEKNWYCFTVLSEGSVTDIYPAIEETGK